MGNILDSIVKYKIVEGPESVSSDYTTDIVDISGVEKAFSVQVDYNNGNTVDIDLYLEVSTNGQTFVRISESLQNVTDNTGTHVWDVTEMGVNYLRVALVVNTGSLDITEIQFSGKRRH